MDRRLLFLGLAIVGGGMYIFAKRKEKQPDLTLKDIVKGEGNFTDADGTTKTVYLPELAKSEKEILEMFDIQS